MTNEVVDKIVTELTFEIPKISKDKLEEYNRLKRASIREFSELNIPQSEINKMRRSLFKSGFSNSFKMSDYETYKTNEDVWAQKKIEKDEGAAEKAAEKAAAKEEKALRKAALQEEKERTGLAKKAFNLMRAALVTKVAYQSVKSVINATQRVSNDSISKYRDSSIFSNMNFKRSQALSNYLEKLGANSDDVLNTVRNYKLKTNRSRMSDEDALKEFVVGINKPNANLAGISAAYGASASMIDALRGISPNDVKKGVDEETKGSYMTEADIATFKEFNKNLEIASGYLGKWHYYIELKAAKLFNNITDFFSGTKEPKKEAGAASQSQHNIVINQNFDIKSSDPEQASNEIKDRMTKEEYLEFVEHKISAVR